jgi:chromosomal replication initiator protein
MNAYPLYSELIKYFIYYAPALNNKNEIKKLDAAICDYFQIPIEKLKQRTRKREIVDARRLYIYALSKGFNLKPPEIAEHTGFDRCTVFYHNKKASNYIETEKDYREKAEMIIRGIHDHNITYY